MKRITKMIAGFLAFSMLATAPESTSAAKVEQGGTKSETNITEYSAATGGAVSGVVTGGAVSEVPTGGAVSASPTPTASAAPTPTATAAPTATATAAPTATPVKAIDKIQIVDTFTNVPYRSSLKKEDFTLAVLYNDGTMDLVHPDSITSVDTSRLGNVTIYLTYKGRKMAYDIHVVPRKASKPLMKKGTTTSMNISWTRLEEAQMYEIYTASQPDGPYTLTATTEKNQYLFENMKPGVIVYVKIRAVASEGAGEESDVAAIAPVPSKVAGVKAVKAAKTSVTLNWQAASGATGYVVYYRTKDGDTFYQGPTSVVTQATVTGLSKGKDYYFMVYAYAADISNTGEASPVILFGTAPASPTIKKVRGGDRRIKVYWKKAAGAVAYRIYLSTKSGSGYKLYTNVSAEDYLRRNVSVPLQKKKYYVKVEAVRTVSGTELASMSTARSAKTAAAKATSTKAKYYKNKKAFKKSTAYKTYKAFRKKVSYAKSIVMPGQITTNVAGFNVARMIPQGITVAGDYMLVSAYDGSKTTESVIFVINRKTKKLCTTVVMPYASHLGGIAYDGTNIWVTYGKNLHSMPFEPIRQAAVNKQKFLEIYRINTVCPMPETVSYVSYYKGMIWAGAYNEKVKKYMYGYQISNKTTRPTLKLKHRMLMPNRTQGVTFTKTGKMIVSRSCQSAKNKSGFMSCVDTYKPTWNFGKYSLKKNARKKTVKVPSMNEGIAICGSYTYLIYESCAFYDCVAPMDRITAFKTKKIS